MLPAQVAVNVTFALVAVVGVTVYFRLPHPVAGVDGVTEAHVPANASTEVASGGRRVGEVGLSFLVRRSQPVVSAHAQRRRMQPQLGVS